MNTFEIEPCGVECREELLALWEASVRATHHFLTERDIETIRPLAAEAFDAVRLFVICDDRGAAAFMGLSDDTIEMLFVRLDLLGRGLGRMMVEYAAGRGIRRVDVNEQNHAAAAFYRRMGFRVVGRDSLDGAGMPFPILHLEL